MINTSKQIIDWTTIFVSLASFITTWIPPIILLLSLLWWIIRYYELLSGNKISDLKIIKFFFIKNKK